MRDAASAQLHRPQGVRRFGERPKRPTGSRENVISDGGNSEPFCVARLNSDGASKRCEYYMWK